MFHGIFPVQYGLDRNFHQEAMMILKSKCLHRQTSWKPNVSTLMWRTRCWGAGFGTKKWHSPMSYRFLPVGKSDQRIIPDNFRKKIWFLGVIKYFFRCPPYVFPDGLKPPTSPMKARVFQLVAVQLRVSQNPLRCTRAGTPDNSADVDYDHFPEEVTGRCDDVHIAYRHCQFVLYVINLLIFCKSNPGLRFPEKIRIQWIFPYLLYENESINRFSCMIEAADFGWFQDSPNKKTFDVDYDWAVAKKGEVEDCAGVLSFQKQWMFWQHWDTWARNGLYTSV